MVGPHSETPLVSVVITTYNRPGLLPDAVESARSQSYENVEIVVVDDGSETPAASVLDDYPDVRVVRHEENQGANAARNTGIRESSGEYVAFLDDDDAWAPEKLSRQVEAFADGVAVVYTGSESVDDEGAVVSRFSPSMRGNVTKDLFCGAQIGGFSLVMVRRSAIDEAGDLDERFPSWQDREWYVRLSLVGEFEYVDDPLVTHRSPEEQISKDFERKRDVSYPLFLEKHRSTAREFGPKYERRLVASLSRTLGASALYCGHHREAVRYLGKSLRLYPASPTAAAYFLLALGGSRTYNGAQRLKQGLMRASSSRSS
jgi:glycosyltransferase involved in cell wall biosynthesis